LERKPAGKRDLGPPLGILPLIRRKIPVRSISENMGSAERGMAQATGLVITGAIPPAAAGAAADIFAGKPIQRRAEHDWFWC
jgi:hypothetical protein